MKKEVEELKERALKPGEVFSRFEMLTAILEAERFHELWDQEWMRATMLEEELHGWSL